MAPPKSELKISKRRKTKMPSDYCICMGFSKLQQIYHRLPDRVISSKIYMTVKMMSMKNCPMYFLNQFNSNWIYTDLWRKTNKKHNPLEKHTHSTSWWIKSLGLWVNFHPFPQRSLLNFQLQGKNKCLNKRCIGLGSESKLFYGRIWVLLTVKTSHK